MKDWVTKLDAFLQFNEREILQDSGKISHEIATRLAENEYEKYQVVQDRILESDFDREVKKLLKRKNSNGWQGEFVCDRLPRLSKVEVEGQVNIGLCICLKIDWNYQII